MKKEKWKGKRWILGICLCALLFGSTFSPGVYAQEQVQNRSQDQGQTQTREEFKKHEFEIQADAAILINADTMEVLYEKNADAKMYPASTTKILSALVAAEHLKLDEVITAPADYRNPDPEGSNIAIDQKEQLTVEQLLNATLIASANDAIEIMSFHISASGRNFMDMVNERAQQVGAVNTHFTNPHGLHDDNHYTTARDLAVISAEMMKNPILREMVGKTEYIIPPTNKKKEERNYLKTTNWFIRDNGNTMNFRGSNIAVRDENVVGIKTGFTDEAGYCLVSEIVKDNRHFIVVVLKAPNRLQSYIDSKNLLYYGLENFKFQNIVSKDETVTTVELEEFNHVSLPLVSSARIAKSMPLDFEKADLKVDVTLLNVDAKVIERDMVMGHAKYYYKEELLGEVDLLASHSVKETDFIGELTTALSSQSDFNFIIKVVAIPMMKLAIAFVIWWLIVTNVRRARSKRRGIDFRRRRR